MANNNPEIDNADIFNLMISQYQDMPVQEEIEQFCSHCDRYTDNTCSPECKDKYVGRDWCGWSSIDGVHIYPVTMDFLTIKGERIPRSDIQRIEDAVRKAREALNINHKPL